MSDKLVCKKFEDLEEGELILAFGKHVVKWDFDELGNPDYGFVPAPDNDPGMYLETLQLVNAQMAKTIDSIRAERDALRERCVDLEARLDIGTGNMFDVVVLENERLRARCAELVEQCNSNYEPLRKQIEQQGLDQAGYEYATQIVIDGLRAELAQAREALRMLLDETLGIRLDGTWQDAMDKARAALAENEASE